MNVIEDFLGSVPESSYKYGENIIFAAVAILFGVILVKFIDKTVKKTFEKIDKQNSLAMQIVLKFVKYLIYTLILLIILIKFDVSTAAILAFMSSAFLTFGIALKDVLSNIAKGIQILFARPYSVGDTIEIDSVLGKVHKIQLMYTHIQTSDNRIVLIPNNVVVAGKVTNYSKEDTRRLEMSFCLKDDFDLIEVKKMIYETIISNDMISEAIPPDIRYVRDGLNSKIVAKVWVDSKNYDSVKDTLTESINLKLR